MQVVNLSEARDLQLACKYRSLAWLEMTIHYGDGSL
jgi:hypothetical protein